MTSKNWYTKDYNRSDKWTKNFYILKKLIGKPGKICTAKPPPPSLKQNSIRLKVLTTASTSRDVRDVYLPLTNLIGIYKRSKEDLAFSKGIFLQKQ